MPTSPFRRLLDRYRYRLLLGLVIAALLLQPLLEGGPTGETMLAALFALILAGTGVVTRSASVSRPLGIAGPLLWLALDLLAQATGSDALGVAVFAIMLWLTGQTVWLTVEALLRERRSEADALAGAVFGYFMLALTWAQLHAATLQVTPGAILAPGETLTGSDLIYFSLVTLTTLGYGDVVPISPMARILAATEAVFGALYIAVLIGRIVSDIKPPRADADGDGDGGTS